MGMASISDSNVTCITNVLQIIWSTESDAEHAREDEQHLECSKFHDLDKHNF